MGHHMAQQGFALWVSVVPSLNRIIGPVRGLGALGGTQYVELVGLAHCWVLRGHLVLRNGGSFLAALVEGFLTLPCCGWWWLFLVGCGCGLSVA